MSLTKQQLAAVQAREQCVLVQACPGSGKTTLLVARIQHLIESGAQPSRIVALMFNRTVRQQFIERLSKTESVDCTAVHIHTFHSFAYAMLVARDPKRVSAIGTAEQFMQVCHEISCDQTVQKFKGAQNLTSTLVADIIGRLSNGLFGLGSQQDPALNVSQLDKAAFELYQQRCRKYNLIFEADLLYCLVSLTENDTELSNEMSQYFDHIMIDEAQDMNWAQITLAMCLKAPESNFTVVYDYDQSIYGFLGAKPQFVTEQLAKHFQNAKLYPLSTTFRYGPVVAALSSKLMHSSPNWSGQHTIAAPGLESHVKLYSPTSNSADVAGQCIQAHLETGVGLNDIAVLVRSYGQTHELCMNLMLRGIAFRVDGGQVYFENFAVNGLCALLRVWAEDSEHCDLADLGSALGFMLPFLHPHQIKASAEETLAQFAKPSPNWSRRIHYAFQAVQKRRAPGFKPLTLIRDVTKSMGIWGAIDPQAPLSNCVDSMRALRAFVQLIDTLDLSIEQAITFIKFSAEKGITPKDQPAIIFTSIHKAKGLEWDVVLLPEIQKGAYSDPLTQSTTAYEEERRLLYVAMTRARAHLILLFPNDGQLMRELGLKTNLPPIPSQSTSPYLRELNLLNTLRFGAALQSNKPCSEFTSGDEFERSYLQASLQASL